MCAAVQGAAVCRAPFTITNVSPCLSSHCDCLWEQLPARPQLQQCHAGSSRLCLGHHPVREDRAQAGAGQRGPGHPEPHPHHPHRAHRWLLPEDSPAGQVLPAAGWSHGQKWVHAGRAALFLKLLLCLVGLQGPADVLIKISWVQNRGCVLLCGECCFE